MNVTLFSPEEFRRKRALKDHFLSSVLKGKTILLKGALNELGQLAELKADVAHDLKDVAEGRISTFDTERIIARKRRPLADRSDFVSSPRRKRTEETLSLVPGKLARCRLPGSNRLY